MDFSKMKEQMGGKVKEELTQKVDEVKADIEKKFSNAGGAQNPDQKASSVEGQKLNESKPEPMGQTNAELNTEDTSAGARAVAESDSSERDDESQDQKEVA
ncbi:MAG TPA: hypothetical protein VFP11_05095 [Candidatus Angelobacter sp.]|nr:hypothetical protein [Candidatus Angelobacter sp.]